MFVDADNIVRVGTEQHLQHSLRWQYTQTKHVASSMFFTVCGQHRLPCASPLRYEEICHGWAVVTADYPKYIHIQAYSLELKWEWERLCFYLPLGGLAMMITKAIQNDTPDIKQVAVINFRVTHHHSNSVNGWDSRKKKKTKANYWNTIICFTISTLKLTLMFVFIF